ncbi:MAG: hypothetical protein KC994_19125 [Candidatus Omnitrophica bacterium]|nr:hypothetical protein [Candidatus Omnitrophota bacterium]
MKRRITFLLVLNLIFSGFASPCACLSCACEEENQPAEEHHSCCHQHQVAEDVSKCCHASSDETRSCCGSKKCQCDHSSMNCDCENHSSDADTTAPQPTNETSAQIQIVASMPTAFSSDIACAPSYMMAACDSIIQPESNLPIYLSNHSILC